MPRDTWAEWSTSSSSKRFGWIVQVVGQRSDANGTTVLMVRSLHRDEFHCHGDINVTSLGKDNTLRRIAGLKRDSLMMSLSCAELGTLTEGGFRPCQALQNFDSGGSSASVNQIVAPVPDPIRRKPSATFDLEDPVQFQEDFRASRVIDSTWPHEGNTVQVTVRGGQAHQPSSSTKTRRLNGVKSAFLRRQVPGDESLRAPNPLRNPDGSF